MARFEAKQKLVSSPANDDEPDLIRPKNGSRAQSVPPKTRNAYGFSAAKSVAASSSKDAGAVDEDQFREAFSDYTRVAITSGSEVESELMRINQVLASPTEDWEKRIESLKRLRGLVVAGAANYKDFLSTMKYVDLALQAAVKDLRSQVVREACITLSFLAERLEMRFERTAEMTLPSLILLVPNSVRIMATSGIVAIRMILTCVHSPKLIPIITQNYMISKSKEIRRACCEFIGLILSKFAKKDLDKHAGVLLEAIKKAMSDADSDARALARQAYYAFKVHYKAQADSLYKELDATKQRQLDEGMSRSTSQNSLKAGTSLSLAPNTAPKTPTSSSLGSHLSKTDRCTGKRESLCAAFSSTVQPPGRRAEALCFRMSRPVPKLAEEVLNTDYGKKKNTRLRKPKKNWRWVECALRIGRDQVESTARPVTDGKRSNSAIDMNAARRARAKAAPMSSTMRTLRPPTRTVVPRAYPSPSVSYSQPGSRSNSPTRFTLAKRTPGSKETSRDNSPVRRAKPGAGYVSRYAVSSQRKQSGSDSSNLFGSRRGSQENGNGYHSDDESEASSLTSEQSLSSHGRSRHIELRDSLTDITGLLSSANWTSKRDGLLSLRQFMKESSRTMSRNELEDVTKIFTRMMNDPTTKVIGMFLDVLYEFVDLYKLELGSWLYTLITKLLAKQGSELVPTVQGKIDKLFSLIRHSFSSETQFQHVLRYMTDQTQTPNVRVKAAILNYLVVLIQNNMNPGDLKNSSYSRLGITRMINWTTDGKTPEIRKNSQQVLVALKQLNDEEFNSMIETLDEYLREAAMKLVNGYPRRPSGLLEEITKTPVTAKKTFSPMDKPASASREARAYNGVGHVASPSQLSSSGNDENLNPETVFTSLRQTSQEIQKFGYSPRRTPVTPSSAATPRTRQIRQQTEPPTIFPGFDDALPTYYDYSHVPLWTTPEEQRNYLSTFTERISEFPKDQQFVVFRHLHEYLPLVSDEVWGEHFLTVLPALYENFQNTQSDVIAWSLACFAQLMKVQPGRVVQYPEMTIVNILDVQKNAAKLIVKAAEDCGYLAAQMFPCDVIIKILVPIVTTQPHPENAAAVRLFSFVAQKASKEDVAKVLPAIIPHLITAYENNEESNMRKECVYALIYTQIKVGKELMEPYLQQLPASKVRLMNLYEKRILQNGSPPSEASGEPASANSVDSPKVNGASDTAV